MTELRSALPALLHAADLASSAHDALVVVVHAPHAAHAATLGPVASAAVAALGRADATFAKGQAPASLLPWPTAPGGRVVVAALGALDEDTDDVRAVSEAAAAAVARAVAAGARHPLLAVSVPTGPKFVHAAELAALAARGSQWAPLEAREAGTAKPAAESITVVGLGPERAAELAAIDRARDLCRDIIATEPERMAPRRVAALCREAFLGTGVTVAVEDDVSAYPLIAAVARASQQVERHRPCVVELRYRPEGEVKRTLLLAGKGVTYDTGGADLKTDGHMAGMSRDKGGAAAVAGLVRAVAALRLPGVEVVGLLGLVRNSIGEESYVTDEIVTSRGGVRVRIGNTDAEGRLVLADLLARCKELAAGARGPILASVATLTGHVYRAFGPYTGLIGNRPARDAGLVEALDQLGDAWGEPAERTRPRREDYAFVAAKSGAEDVLSCNNAASSATARGHQFPFAFLDITAGLRGGPLPFVHIDIGGSALAPADWQAGLPTCVPMLSLLALLGGER
ncbi:MAG: aminopeptidase [Polyangiaceae bacterium]|nr:aminopeptidase [Polyangiaceae bacterium]